MPHDDDLDVIIGFEPATAPTIADGLRLIDHHLVPLGFDVSGEFATHRHVRRPGRQPVDVFVGIFEGDTIAWYPGARGGLTRAIVFPPVPAELLGVPCLIPASPRPTSNACTAPSGASPIRTSATPGIDRPMRTSWGPPTRPRRRRSRDHARALGSAPAGRRAEATAPQVATGGLRPGGSGVRHGPGRGHEGARHDVPSSTTRRRGAGAAACPGGARRGDRDRGVARGGDLSLRRSPGGDRGLAGPEHGVGPDRRHRHRPGWGRRRGPGPRHRPAPPAAAGSRLGHRWGDRRRHTGEVDPDRGGRRRHRRADARGDTTCPGHRRPRGPVPDVGRHRPRRPAAGHRRTDGRRHAARRRGRFAAARRRPASPRLAAAASRVARDLVAGAADRRRPVRDPGCPHARLRPGVVQPRAVHRGPGDPRQPRAAVRGDVHGRRRPRRAGDRAPGAGGSDAPGAGGQGIDPSHRHRPRLQQRGRDPGRDLGHRGRPACADPV